MTTEDPAPSFPTKTPSKTTFFRKRVRLPRSYLRNPAYRHPALLIGRSAEDLPDKIVSARYNLPPESANAEEITAFVAENHPFAEKLPRRIVRLGLNEKITKKRKIEPNLTIVKNYENLYNKESTEFLSGLPRGDGFLDNKSSRITPYEAYEENAGPAATAYPFASSWQTTNKHGVHWSRKEKDRFFTHLGRCSRHRMDEVARRVGTKTESECWAYYNLLSSARDEAVRTGSSMLVRYNEIPFAREMSPRWVALEQRMAQRVLQRDQGTDFTREVAQKRKLGAETVAPQDLRLDGITEANEQLLYYPNSSGLINLTNYHTLISGILGSLSPRDTELFDYQFTISDEALAQLEKTIAYIVHSVVNLTILNRVRENWLHSDGLREESLYPLEPEISSESSDKPKLSFRIVPDDKLFLGVRMRQNEDSIISISESSGLNYRSRLFLRPVDCADIGKAVKELSNGFNDFVDWRFLAKKYREAIQKRQRQGHTIRMRKPRFGRHEYRLVKPEEVPTVYADLVDAEFGEEQSGEYGEYGECGESGVSGAVGGSGVPKSLTDSILDGDFLPSTDDEAGEADSGAESGEEGQQEGQTEGNEESNEPNEFDTFSDNFQGNSLPNTIPEDLNTVFLVSETPLEYLDAAEAARVRKQNDLLDDPDAQRLFEAETVLVGKEDFDISRAEEHVFLVWLETFREVRKSGGEDVTDEETDEEMEEEMGEERGNLTDVTTVSSNNLTDTSARNSADISADISGSDSSDHPTPRKPTSEPSEDPWEAVYGERESELEISTSEDDFGTPESEEKPRRFRPGPFDAFFESESDDLVSEEEINNLGMLRSHMGRVRSTRISSRDVAAKWTRNRRSEVELKAFQKFDFTGLSEDSVVEQMRTFASYL